MTSKLLSAGLKVTCAAVLINSFIVPTWAADKAPATPVVVAAPAEGKSNIVFFRPGSMVGAAIRCTVREDGKMIGRMGSGDYFVHTAEPGTHAFSAETEAKDVVTLETEAGETYYVKCKIAAGFMAGRPNLSPADAPTFDAVSAKLDLISPEKMAETIAKDEAKQGKQ
jgi:Protein of unknown function (DUF2846)